MKYAGMAGVFPLVCDQSSADFSAVSCLLTQPVIYLAVAAGILLFLYMLYHWAVSKRSLVGRLAWLLVILAFAPEGAVAYYFFVFRREGPVPGRLL